MTRRFLLTLIVEEDFDRNFVISLFRNARYPVDLINVVAADGKMKLQRTIERESFRDNVAVLIDYPSSTNNIDELAVRKKLKIPDFVKRVFVAIPTIEAWLFADIDAARRMVRNHDLGNELLDRIPLPDEIPYPRFLAKNLFTYDQKFNFLQNEMNIEVAMARSPSLRNFMVGVAEIIHFNEVPEWERNYVRSAARDVFAQLVDEIVPPEKIIYQTLDGTKRSAKEMSRDIREGSEVGLKYGLDVLRLARDLLEREVNKK